jgi:hypothetical protein
LGLPQWPAGRISESRGLLTGLRLAQNNRLVELNCFGVKSRYMIELQRARLFRAPLGRPRGQRDVKGP